MHRSAIVDAHPRLQTTPPGEAPAIHWDEVYRGRSTDQLSWFQAAPAMSLELFDALAVPSGAAIIVATFAADGPDSCSGLPVMRYDSAALAASLGSDFEMSLSRRELHVTPSGLVQPFTWVAGRRGRAAGR